MSSPAAELAYTLNPQKHFLLQEGDTFICLIQSSPHLEKNQSDVSSPSGSDKGNTSHHPWSVDAKWHSYPTLHIPTPNAQWPEFSISNVVYQVTCGSCGYVVVGVREGTTATKICLSKHM